MSQESKLLLVIFSALLVIVAAGVGAGIFALSHVAREAAANAHDPVAMARIAAKLARFTVPPGYRIASAIDLGISQDATIEPINGGAFEIRMSSASPGSHAIDLGASGAGFRLGAIVSSCEFKSEADASFVVRGEIVPFKVMTCNASSGPRRVELGFVRGSVMNVRVFADGVDGDFDEAALRELLSSFK